MPVPFGDWPPQEQVAINLLGSPIFSPAQTRTRLMWCVIAGVSVFILVLSLSILLDILPRLVSLRVFPFLARVALWNALLLLLSLLPLWFALGYLMDIYQTGMITWTFPAMVILGLGTVVMTTLPLWTAPPESGDLRLGGVMLESASSPRLAKLASEATGTHGSTSLRIFASDPPVIGVSFADVEFESEILPGPHVVLSIALLRILTVRELEIALALAASAARQAHAGEIGRLLNLRRRLRRIGDRFNPSRTLRLASHVDLVLVSLDALTVHAGIVLTHQWTADLDRSIADSYGSRATALTLVKLELGQAAWVALCERLELDARQESLPTDVGPLEPRFVYSNLAEQFVELFYSVQPDHVAQAVDQFLNRLAVLGSRYDELLPEALTPVDEPACLLIDAFRAIEQEVSRQVRARVVLERPES